MRTSICHRILRWKKRVLQWVAYWNSIDRRCRGSFMDSLRSGPWIHAADRLRKPCVMSWNRKELPLFFFPGLLWLFWVNRCHRSFEVSLPISEMEAAEMSVELALTQQVNWGPFSIRGAFSFICFLSFLQHILLFSLYVLHFPYWLFPRYFVLLDTIVH